MALTYYVSLTLALFAGALPAQIAGVLWESISQSITAEIPYIALLRLLGGAGALAAVILSDRIRGYILARDLIVGAIALEATSVIGFSLSREFWNLAVWITALGFSLGLCITLICYLLRGTGSERTCLVFAASALGTGTGACLVRQILLEGRSWRTACQGIAILQVVLCMSIFLLRRTLLRDVAAILKGQKRKREMERLRRRDELIRSRGEVDERSSLSRLIRILLVYGSALSCGLLLLSAAHLIYSAQIAEGEETADLALSILTVCAGMAAGRIVAGGLIKNALRACRIGSFLTTALLALGLIALRQGLSSDIPAVLMRAGTGAGAGIVFPNLIRLEDERLDEEAQMRMAGLIPAFYLGAEAMITPFLQSVTQAFSLSACIFAMLVLSLGMTLCVILFSAPIHRG